MPYQRAKLYDETVLLIEVEGRTMPAMVSNSDSGVFTGIDDKSPITIYHRVTGTSEETLDGFGDEDNEVIETTEMLMVVTNNREHTNIKGVDLARYIKGGFRSYLTASEINTPGISQVSIQTGSVELDRNSVIEAEYTELRSLPANYDVFSIAYEIQMKMDKNCLALCEV